MIYEYLDKYGVALLSALGFETMKVWYGRPFVLWYNATYKFGGKV